SRGQLATNAQLVERAVTINEAMNVKIMTPQDVRAKLKLTKR
ncbi:MAG: 3-keto-5-aminohexanoate cleavage protein, partial [Alphaproteobacteria bacterium]